MERSSAATARTMSADEQPADAPVTPMMRQYLEAKARAGDAFLFFRLGDFYEMFFEDAVPAAELLRHHAHRAAPRGADRVPMCGVPYHAARRYIARLIEDGHKVAICEQVEAAGPGPGIVRREMVRGSSPRAWCWTRTCSSRARTTSWLVAVRAGRRTLAAPRCSTPPPASSSRSRARRCPRCWRRVAAREPRELLVPDGRVATGCGRAVRAIAAAAPRSPSCERRAFDASAGRRRSSSAHFGVAVLEGFGLDGAAPGRRRRRRGAALPQGHPEHRRAPRRRAPAGSAGGARWCSTRPPGPTWSCSAPCATARGAGSLLGVLDRTATALGARKLAALAARAAARPRRRSAPGWTRWRSCPPRPSGARRWPALLKEVADLERLLRTASPPALGNAAGPARAWAGRLAVLPDVARGARRLPRGAAARPRRAAPGACRALAALLQRALVDEPPADAGRGRVHPARLLTPSSTSWWRSSTERQGLPAQARDARARAHRHRLAQGPLQQGLRLLPRGHPGEPAPGARGLRSASRPRWAPSASSPRSSRSTRRRCSPPRRSASRWSCALFEELRAAGGGAGGRAARGGGGRGHAGRAASRFARVRGRVRLRAARWWTTRTCSSSPAGRHPVVERALRRRALRPQRRARSIATDAQLAGHHRARTWPARAR